MQRGREEERVIQELICSNSYICMETAKRNLNRKRN
jgi:hypothetical protein